MEGDYLSRLTALLTGVRGVNRTDAHTLGTAFGSLGAMMRCKWVAGAWRVRGAGWGAGQGRGAGLGQGCERYNEAGTAAVAERACRGDRLVGELCRPASG